MLTAIIIASLILAGLGLLGVARRRAGAAVDGVDETNPTAQETAQNAITSAGEPVSEEPDERAPFKDRLEFEVEIELAGLMANGALDEGNRNVLDGFIDDMVDLEFREIDARTQARGLSLAAERARLKSTFAEQQDGLESLGRQLADSEARYREVSGNPHASLPEILAHASRVPAQVRIGQVRSWRRPVTEAELRHLREDYQSAQAGLRKAEAAFHRCGAAVEEGDSFVEDGLRSTSGLPAGVVA